MAEQFVWVVLKLEFSMDSNQQHWWEERPEPDWEKVYGDMAYEDRRVGRTFETYKGETQETCGEIFLQIVTTALMSFGMIGYFLTRILIWVFRLNIQVRRFNDMGDKDFVLWGILVVVVSIGLSIVFRIALTFFQ